MSIRIVFFWCVDRAAANQITNDVWQIDRLVYVWCLIDSVKTVSVSSSVEISMENGLDMLNGDRIRIHFHCAVIVESILDGYRKTGVDDTFHRGLLDFCGEKCQFYNAPQCFQADWILLIPQSARRFPYNWQCMLFVHIKHKNEHKTNEATATIVHACVCV